MILHLGVMDIPYEADGVTTGDVAEWLEENYKIMQMFFDVHAGQIGELMANDLAGSLETFMLGGPLAANPFLGSMDKIHDLFVIFILTRQLDGQPGVPTHRALMGIRKRLKNRRGPPRESFNDTGLYLASMRAWVTDIANNANN